MQRAVNAALESKFVTLDLKSIAGEGIFEGYASLFNRADMSGDVVLPGAFRESLGRRGASGIKLLFQHDPSEPIGVWQRIVEDKRGLFVRGRLLLELARAREIHLLMRAGAVDGLSIGFRAVSARRDRATGQRRLEKIDLWEISVVTFPMLPEARVAAVKQRPGIPEVAVARDGQRRLIARLAATARHLRHHHHSQRTGL